MASITRRDFLNGVALTVAAGLTPAAQLAAQTRRYPPALTGLRGQHVGSFEVAHALGAGGPQVPGRRAAGRRELRSRRGRRRHQRACRGIVLSPRQSVRAHPHPRQPRRFRRPRQAQRVQPRWPPHHRLRRQPVAAIAEHAVQRGGEGADRRSRRRHQAVRDRLRPQVLSVAWPVARDVLQPRGVRPRRAGDRRSGRRRGQRQGQFQAGGGVRVGLSDLRRQQGADRGALCRRERSARRKIRTGNARAAQAHQLPRLPDENLRLQRGSGQLLPGPAARLFRSWQRCRAGRRRPRSRLSGLCRPEASGRRQRRLEGALHLSFPRRQRVDCAPAGAFAHSESGAGTHHGGRGAGAVRLCRARPGRPAGPHPARFDLRSRGAERRQGADRLCPRRQAASGRGAPRRAGLLPHDDPVYRAGPATAAARGAGEERQDAALLHQRAGAQLARVHEPQGQLDLGADGLSPPGVARFPGQPRRRSPFARSGESRSCCTWSMCPARRTRASTPARNSTSARASSTP